MVATHFYQEEDQIEFMVFEDDLNALFLPSEISISYGTAPSVTSYPAGGDDQFAFALEYDYRDIKLFIYDSEAELVDDFTIADPEEDVKQPNVATLASENLVVAYKKSEDEDHIDVFKIFYPGNSSFSDMVLVSSDAQYSAQPYVAPLTDGGFAYASL